MMSNIVLVTGATGFLGKVLVEELLRQRNSYDISKILLLIRPTKNMDAHQRFVEHVASSPCFAKLTKEWTNHVQVSSGDLAVQKCGIAEFEYTDITQRITHIIHVAGCIKFDCKVSEALSSNVDGALNILAMARDCKKLQQLVFTSTAYVMPAQTHPIHETLVQLPQSATHIYNDLRSGSLSKQQALALTNLPNIYSLSKCLAENLIIERQASLPITIVRPSIICAAWKYPIPGWIDSKAAFAGLVLCFQMGILKVVNGRRDTKLDIVPVDIVAAQLIHQTFQGHRGNSQDHKLLIVFSVATAKYSLTLGDICDILEAYFDRKSPVASRPNFRHVGGQGLLFKLCEIFYNRMRLHLHATICSIQGRYKEAAEARNAYRLVTVMNTLFEPYTNQTFDFRTAKPVNSPNPYLYLRIILEGVCRNLM